MRNIWSMRGGLIAFRACATAVFVAIGGCQSAPSPWIAPETGPQPPAGASSTEPGGLANAAKAALEIANASSDVVLAYVNGKAVRLSTLRRPLLESAGGQVLSEVILDRMLNQRLAKSNLTLTPDLINAEKKLLLQTLSRNVARQQQNDASQDALDPSNQDRAVLLLRALRHQRGLGDQRFHDLLRRNAAMRLLVRDQVKVTQAALHHAYQLAYGLRYQARIVVVPTLKQAAKLRTRLTRNEMPSSTKSDAYRGDLFANLAVQYSTDPSAVQGGLLPTLSPVDPGFPQILRDALTKLDEQGQTLSEVIALDQGYALIKLVRKIAPRDVQFADVKDELTHQVRLAQQSVLMRQLARKLLAQADVLVINPTLKASWQRQKEALQSAD